MICSRLLKSCATPPVRWPIASIFCDWRTMPSARIRAVTSGDPDQEAAGGDRRLVDIQFASRPRRHAGRPPGCSPVVGRRQDLLRPALRPAIATSLVCLEPGQTVGQVQQPEKAGIEGAEQPVGGEIGDAVAHRVQRRLQDRRFVGAGAFGRAQADIVAHQHGGGDQQDAQGQDAGADGESDFQRFLLDGVRRRAGPAGCCSSARPAVTSLRIAAICWRPRCQRLTTLRASGAG